MGNWGYVTLIAGVISPPLGSLVVFAAHLAPLVENHGSDPSHGGVTMDDKDKKHTGKEAGDRGDEFRAIPSDILKHGTKGPIFGCLGYIIGDEKLPS